MTCFLPLLFTAKTRSMPVFLYHDLASISNHLFCTIPYFPSMCTKMWCLRHHSIYAILFICISDIVLWSYILQRSKTQINYGADTICVVLVFIMYIGNEYWLYSFSSLPLDVCCFAFCCLFKFWNCTNNCSAASNLKGFQSLCFAKL